jgi:ribonuclease HIII
MYLNIKSYSKESFDDFYKIVSGYHNGSNSKVIHDEVIYDGITITFYKNLTILFKGNNIDKLRKIIETIVDKTLYVGIDEVGVGENIGPMLACGVRFNDFESKMNVIMSGIKDSKKMTYDEISNLSKIIEKNSEINCYGFNPEKFNELYKTVQNVKAINAMIQNKINNDFDKYPDHVGDEFVNKKKYFEYLEQ